MLKKIYADHYAVLLDEKQRVIWACGSEEWQEFYKQHPKLKYEKGYNIWTVKRIYEEIVLQ